MKIRSLFNGKDSRPYIIAEMANAHNGDKKIAKAIVLSAAKAGADAVKFQFFTPDELAVPSYSSYELYKRLQMPESSWRELFKLAKKRGLEVLVDVFGLQSAKMAVKLGTDGFKIHNADINSLKLIQYVAGTKKPVILSCGGSLPEEISNAISTIRKMKNRNIMLMFGIQSYPTDISDSFLGKIKLFIKKFDVPVGFASHLEGGKPESIAAPSWAVIAGASAVEVHITIDRSQKLPDYYSSLEPDEFSKMALLVRDVHLAMQGDSLKLSKKELDYRLRHKKFLVASKDIRKNESLTESNTALKRINNPSENSVTSMMYILGKRSKRALSLNSPISKEDIK